MEYLQDSGVPIGEDTRPGEQLLIMPAPAIIKAIQAGIVAAGKTAGTIGAATTGGVASYLIIDKIKRKQQPMISHAISSGASETKSDSLLAVNFGGTESAMILMATLL